jgi:hypothetical protein
LGRIIKFESAGKERDKLVKEIVISIRELMKQSRFNENSRELAAFIALSLESISETIEVSVVAWEKRGYWVKADRFRLEWTWAGKLGTEMRKAVLSEDWKRIVQTALEVARKLYNVKVSVRHHLGTPWVGAWQRMQSKALF